MNNAAVAASVREIPITSPVYLQEPRKSSKIQGSRMIKIADLFTHRIVTDKTDDAEKHHHNNRHKNGEYDQQYAEYLKHQRIHIDFFCRIRETEPSPRIIVVILSVSATGTVIMPTIKEADENEQIFTKPLANHMNQGIGLNFM